MSELSDIHVRTHTHICDAHIHTYPHITIIHTYTICDAHTYLKKLQEHSGFVCESACLCVLIRTKAKNSLVSMYYMCYDTALQCETSYKLQENRLTRNKRDPHPAKEPHKKEKETSDAKRMAMTVAKFVLSFSSSV